MAAGIGHDQTGRVTKAVPVMWPNEDMLECESYRPEFVLRKFGEGDREPASGSWWWGYLFKRLTGEGKPVLPEIGVPA